MRSFGTLLALPSTLLRLLLCTPVHGQEILEGLGPIHDTIVRREQDVVHKLATRQPNGVRKMSLDAGEKFWPHYWEFGDATDDNTTVLQHPLALHSSSRQLSGRAIFARDAACPSGTSSCTSIGHSDSCCPSGDTCIIVQDTGNGPVGCCAAGQSCGNTIGDCNTSQGYSACPNSSNKGCCIPGYACSGNICINVGTQTVTPVQSTTSSSATSSSSTQVVVSVVTVVNISGFTTTATVTQTVTQSASESTSSDTAAAPVRPTTNSDTTAIAAASATISSSSSSSTITSTITSSGITICPTGYYMCSAVYLGGCCQVDRDCNTTYCPSTATTTVIGGGEATVVAPTGASSNVPTCANGWYLCPVSVGGNCCPSGYSCGQTNCPASASGASATNKIAPNDAAGVVMPWLYAVLAVTTAVGMIML